MKTNAYVAAFKLIDAFISSNSYEEVRTLLILFLRSKQRVRAFLRLYRKWEYQEYKAYGKPRKEQLEYKQGIVKAVVYLCDEWSDRENSYCEVCTGRLHLSHTHEEPDEWQREHPPVPPVVDRWRVLCPCDGSCERVSIELPHSALAAIEAFKANNL